MLVQTKNLSFVASVQRGNFRRAKRHSFWNEDEIGPYNTGISNMEYALNFSSCLFMRATAMSRAESQRPSYLLQSHIIGNAYFVGDWQLPCLGILDSGRVVGWPSWMWT